MLDEELAAEGAPSRSRTVCTTLLLRLEPMLQMLLLRLELMLHMLLLRLMPSSLPLLPFEDSRIRLERRLELPSAPLLLLEKRLPPERRSFASSFKVSND
mmetsp:Transcript_41179/g.101629  ORF Transcript_41179/g.101629 Transcript_41179/m.101629 type:complete len:100 (+) Transcript_41179:1678-1977(+)